MTEPELSSEHRFSKVPRRFLVAILLVLFAFQVVLTSREMSPGWDEAYIPPSGYIFLKTGQWIVPEHPPLIFALSALPLLVLNPRLNLQDPEFARQPSNYWTVGRNFLSANDDDDRLFFWGRLPVLLLALLLAYFVYRWAQELHGGYAGLMALLLYAFCPTMIAHSGFIEYDVGLSFFFTLRLYMLWRFMAQGTWRGHPSRGSTSSPRTRANTGQRVPRDRLAQAVRGDGRDRLFGICVQNTMIRLKPQRGADGSSVLWSAVPVRKRWKGRVATTRTLALATLDRTVWEKLKSSHRCDVAWIVCRQSGAVTDQEMMGLPGPQTRPTEGSRAENMQCTSL